jgi:hypothetical protein
MVLRNIPIRGLIHDMKSNSLGCRRELRRTKGQGILSHDKGNWTEFGLVQLEGDNR